ncbi:hypothetical protein [Rhizobium leguminosarum]|uniref:hypothetical protein n=1 Tax=Rhizobium leguminosarum TaxID=384 RepID=UPI0015F9EEA5|nr:hypothetical protein [Rhizobium leguminosarum]MBA9030930.1 hypothetical protein [Rhizobium leguminosarum]
MKFVKADWETKLIKAERGFRIDNKPVGRLSLATNPQDGVVLPIQMFLLEGAVRRGDPWRTNEKHAYQLVQWYDYLRYNKIGIFDAVEDDLRNFLLGGGGRYGNLTALNRKVELTLTSTNLAKMRTIVAFYDYWERKRGRELRKARGLSLAQIDEEVFFRKNRSISKAQINFSRSEAQKAQRDLATPSPDEIEFALDRALEHPDDNRGQTWYLIGSLARRSGSRACGIATLHVQKLLDGIAQETYVRKIPNYRTVLRDHLKKENRTLITEALQSMQRARRRYIFCNVKAKGGEWTWIAVPIELAVELIDYICNARQDLVRKRFTPKNKKPPPQVFLSYKTGNVPESGALSPEAICNHWNKILNDLKIEGTFHRIRATFCEEIVREAYVRERALQGSAWQVVNVLEFARRLLGHKNIESLQPYLNNVLAQEILDGDLVMVRSPHDAALLRGLSIGLERPDADDLRSDLEALMEKHSCQPLVEAERRYALM